MVDVAAVYDYLWDETLPTMQVLAHLNTVTAMVKAYTRGQGFIGDVPAADLAAVIVTCAARMLGNPQLSEMTAIDDYTERPGRFIGWTLPELAVLNGYRRRTA